MADKKTANNEVRWYFYFYIYNCSEGSSCNATRRFTTALNPIFQDVTSELYIFLKMKSYMNVSYANAYDKYCELFSEKNDSRCQFHQQVAFSLPLFIISFITLQSNSITTNGNFVRNNPVCHN